MGAMTFARVGADDSWPEDLWPRTRRRYEVFGVVQGVGFRPFVYVTACELALCGFVVNTGSGVVIEVEGGSGAIKQFGSRLRENAPPLAVIEDIVESEEATLGGTEFTIGDSRERNSGSGEDSHGSGEGNSRSRTLASPDVATCTQCLQEMRDPQNRRYRHPFITCTNCGPRFTIIADLPYDRAATTMAAFAMCEACRKEYQDPGDRRFHAQPIACHDCGPVLTLVHRGDRLPGGDRPAEAPTSGEDALREARSMLVAGAILAVKGLGGYHLACDARNAAAVAELRRRKRRGNKPFAVMVRDSGVARDLATMTDSEEELLAGIRRPIVLLRRGDSETAAHLASSVAPGSPSLGVMLPYTPLHALLFGLDGDPSGPDALVMTSGNASGEPIVTGDQQALETLAPFVDAWLFHDRRIQVPCDDSVTRIVRRAVGSTAGLSATESEEAELPVRRSRGYAPLPIALPFEVGPTLAVGADLKNTCAVASGRYAWVSQHIGDMDDLATLEALTRTERHLELLTGVRPEQLIADQHPGYRSSGWARQQANGRTIRQVQHHHAHIASVMGEHGLGAGEKVIGFAFDGTGYGSDGAVWGGEVLLATYTSFRRAAHLGYVPLAGGDATVLRPYRMALAHLHAAGVPWDERLPPVLSCPVVERDVLAHQFATGLGSVPTSSMGRLFDAVASLAGVRQTVDYEAEAAIELEGLAGSWPAPTSAAQPTAPRPRASGAAAPRPRARKSPMSAYRFDIRRRAGEGPLIADPSPLIRAVAADVLAGMPIPQIARLFHDALTQLIVDLAQACREETGLSLVALGGGVFQNTLLVEAADRALSDRGFTVLLPRMLPPNDGGIALGQILIGASTR
jgi:hydrogenase maturation protein HypF